jgi:hypothetical protein
MKERKANSLYCEKKKTKFLGATPISPRDLLELQLGTR